MTPTEEMKQLNQRMLNLYYRKMADELLAPNPLMDLLNANRPKQRPLSRWKRFKYEAKTRLEYTWNALKGDYGCDS